MSTLYELTTDYQQLLELAEDPEIDPQVINDTLEGLTGEIEEKADGYAKVIRQLEANILTLKMEEERMARKRRTIDSNIDRMKASLEQAMRITNKPKFRTELFSFNIRKNPPKLVIDQESTDHALADYIIIQPPIWNKAKLKEDLKAGKDVDGIAHLEQTETLQIR